MLRTNMTFNASRDNSEKLVLQVSNLWYIHEKMFIEDTHVKLMNPPSPNY